MNNHRHLTTTKLCLPFNQNSPSNSTETPSPNSSMNHTNGMMGGTTNMPATNSVPNMNMPASTKTTGAANDPTR